MSIGTVVFFGLIVCIVIYGIMLYNGLVSLKHGVAKAWANIDVLLKQRHDELPKLVSSRSATIPTFKKRELFYSPWWMVLLVVLASVEWLFRRLWQLK